MCCFCRKDTTNSPSAYQKHNIIYTVKTHHSDFLDNQKPRLFQIYSQSLIAESFQSTIFLPNHKKVTESLSSLGDNSLYMVFSKLHFLCPNIRSF